MVYSLDEICLIPNTTSTIEHRSDVNVFTNKNNYPIFTAPMSCIVDSKNYDTLKEHRLNVIIPRSVLIQPFILQTSNSSILNFAFACLIKILYSVFLYFTTKNPDSKAKSEFLINITFQKIKHVQLFLILNKKYKHTFSL